MDKILIGREYIKEVMIKIQEEKESIDICIYEMFHGQSTRQNNVRDMFENVLEKQDQGIKVRMIMNTTLANPKNKQNMQSIKEIIEMKGGQVIEIKKGILMHAKAIQFGKKYIIIGSHNISDRSFKSHYEISVGTEGEEINRVYSEWFEKHFI